MQSEALQPQAVLLQKQCEKCHCSQSLPEEMALFQQNGSSQMELFSVIFLRALLIECSARALDPQGEFTEQEIVRSSQCGWCLAA